MKKKTLLKVKLMFCYETYTFDSVVIVKKIMGMKVGGTRRERRERAHNEWHQKSKKRETQINLTLCTLSVSLSFTTPLALHCVVLCCISLYFSSV